MSVHYNITANNDDFKRKFSEVRSEIRNSEDTAQRASANIQSSIKSMAAGMGGLFAIGLAKQFAGDVERVRGEFQQLEIAFETMLGSREKADVLMRQAVDTAAKTPFDLNQVASGYKQLLAYGIGVEKLNDTLVTLGDVASGVNAPLNDIVYLYGTLNASGRVALMDIRQFAGRGIPIYEELAKVLGIAKEKVNDFASEGKIGFADVEQAFKNMTSEGGRFDNLMQKQSASIVGLKANFGDAVDTAKNDLGKKLQPLFEGALKAQINIVENYEEIGKTLLGIAAAYGTYKAVLIAVSAAEKINTQVLRQAVLEKALAAKQTIVLSNAEAVNIARTKTLTLAKQGLSKSLKSLLTALTPNPYFLAAAAVAGLTFAIYKMTTADSAAEMAVKSLANAQESRTKAIEDERSKTEELINKLKNETLTRRERNTILTELQRLYPVIFKGLDIEKAKYLDLAETIKLVNEELEAKTRLQLKEEIAQSQSIYNKLSKGQTSYTREESKAIFKEAKGILGISGFDAAMMSWTKMNEAMQLHLQGLKKQESDILLSSYNAVSNEEKRNRLIIERNKLQEKYDSLSKEDNSKWANNEFARTSLLEQYEKKILQINKQIEGYGATVENVVSKNKSYWEEEKKNAEDALGMLTTENTAKEWEDARERVLKAQKEIAKYSVSEKSKTDNVKKDNYIFDVEREQGIEKIRQDVKAFFDARRKANLEGVKAEREAEEEARIEYLIEWGNFEQKRLALIDKYEKNASKAKTKAEKDGLLKGLEQSLQDIASEQLKSGGLFEKMFGDVERLSTDTLVEILGIDDYIDKLGLSIEETKVFKDAITNARNELEKRNPFKSLSKDWKDLIDAINGNDKDEIKNILDRLQRDLDKAKAYLNDVGDSIGSIFSSFGNDVVGESINNIIGIIGGVGQAGVGIGKLASGDVIGGMKDLAKGISDVVGGIVRMNDAVKERRIQQLQKQIDELTKSYKELGDAIEKAYSKDASNLIEQQNVLLRQKQIAIRQQIKEEEAKKKTDKNKIKEWQDASDEIDKQIAENKVKAIDAIYGEDIKSAIDRFANAYVNMWSAGDDKAKSRKDFVKSMIKSMIIEAMKADISKPMEAIRERMNAFWMDERITDQEADIIDQMLFDLQNQLDKKYSWADKYMNDEISSGTTGELKAAMTEQTGSQLVGLWNMTAMDIRSIRERIEKNETRDSSGDIRSIAILSSEISRNTRDTADNTTGIRDQFSEMNEKLDDIKKNTKPNNSRI